MGSTWLCNQGAFKNVIRRHFQIMMLKHFSYAGHFYPSLYGFYSITWFSQFSALLQKNHQSSDAFFKRTAANFFTEQRKWNNFPRLHTNEYWWLETIYLCLIIEKKSGGFSPCLTRTWLLAKKSMIQFEWQGSNARRIIASIGKNAVQPLRVFAWFPDSATFDFMITSNSGKSFFKDPCKSRKSLGPFFKSFCVNFRLFQAQWKVLFRSFSRSFCENIVEQEFCKQFWNKNFHCAVKAQLVNPIQDAHLTYHDKFWWNKHVLPWFGTLKNAKSKQIRVKTPLITSPTFVYTYASLKI